MTLTLLYSGDAVSYRRKRCGMTLVDQLLTSVESVRERWSSDLPIIFAHTRDLPGDLAERLDSLKVQSFKLSAPLETTFPLANKIQAGLECPVDGDILFLDCDTRIHRPPHIDWRASLLVAFDVVNEVSADNYKRFYAAIGIPCPKGELSPCPARDYYYGDSTHLFPILNSGVFFVSARWRYRFYAEWARIFKIAFVNLAADDWTFYLEQMAFAAAMHSLKIPFDFLPRGVNFICTPMARELVEWPAQEIYIEHYAGNFSQPLVVDQGKIDPLKSGLYNSIFET